MQNQLQTSKQEKFTNEKRHSSLLEKMLIQRIHPDDISTLMMDTIILGVQAVMRQFNAATKERENILY